MSEITLPTRKLQWEVVFAKTHCATAAELTAYCAQGSGGFLFVPDEGIKFSFVTGFVLQVIKSLLKANC